MKVRGHDLSKVRETRLQLGKMELLNECNWELLEQGRGYGRRNVGVYDLSR